MSCTGPCRQHFEIFTARHYRTAIKQTERVALNLLGHVTSERKRNIGEKLTFVEYKTGNQRARDFS